MARAERAQILFVCTGNTCRSPLAEALARQRIAQLDLSVHVTSAGVSARDGESASADAQTAARDAQLDLSKHRARLLTRAMLLESDLVLTMSESHAQLARVLAPEVADRVHRLGDYAEDLEAELPDPFGRGLPAYRETLNVLRGWVSRSLERYVERAKSHER